MEKLNKRDSKAKQSKAKQSKAKQSKAKQSKAKQSKAKQFGCFLLLFFMTLNIFSKSYSQKTTLSLNFKEAKIQKVISFIESKTDYRFLYQTSELNPNTKISINYQGEITRAIDLLFKKSSVYPVIVNKQVILKSRTHQKQTFEVSGVVADEFGTAMEGVTVLINKIERGTSTDFNGRYRIKAKQGDTISFSFIGYKTKSLVIANQKVINITMVEDIDVLDEVVIAYGSTKKNKVSTAIETIKARDIQENLQSGATLDRSLDGLVKGVQFTGGSGRLGEAANINIRGITSPFSNSSNNPLFVIDGVPFFTNSGKEFSVTDRFNPLETINPDDIESVTVLKDASATSLWGSRGANGVIIVKTKRGKVGQPLSIKITSQTTFARPSKTLEYLNAKDYKDYTRKLSENSYNFYKKNPKYGQDYLTGFESVGIKSEGDILDENSSKLIYDPSSIIFYNANTNWNDVVYRSPAYTNQLSTNISGGGEKSSYTLSLGYVNQEGLLKADELEKYNARINIFLNLKENLSTGATVNFNQSVNKTGFSQALTNNLGSELLKFRPDLPVYDKNGNLTQMSKESDDLSGASITYFTNPLGATTKRMDASRTNYGILGNIFIEYEIIKDLKLKAQFSSQYIFGNSRGYEDKKYSSDGYSPGGEQKSILKLDNFNIRNTIVDYTATYIKNFSKHSVEGMLGFSHNKEKTTENTFQYAGFNTPLIEPQGATEIQDRNRSTSEHGLNSLLGRVSYSYDDTYGVTANLRLDRSSKFGPDNRNALFPSVSAFWNIHREKFMDNLPLQQLKLRIGSGITGSTNMGNNFDFLQAYVTNNPKYRNGPTTGFSQEVSLGNSALKWEKTTGYNLGLEFELKKSVLRGSIDLYHKTSTDVLSSNGAPLESGLSRMPFNSATIENRGVELGLGGTIISNDNFNWTVNFNASRNLNKVLSMSNTYVNTNTGAEVDSQIGFKVGREVNIIRGFIVDGIYKDQATIDELNVIAKSKGYNYYDKEFTSVGDYRFRDISGPDGKPDGRITLHDRVIIGSGQPDVFGGFNTNLRYKNYSLGVNFSYSFGGETARRTSLEDNSTTLLSNVETYLAPRNRWSADNPNAKLPRLIYGDPSGNNRFSTANIFDSSYVRLTSVRFGYDLPSVMLEKIKINRLTLFVRGTNLYTWSYFPGLDPQGGIGGAGSSESVVNSDSYPSARTFSLGATINF